MDYVLEVKRLSKVFGKQAAVKDISLKVKQGEIFGLIGKNGAGKTTFLKLACGLLSPSEGEIKVFGSTKGLYSRMGILIENPGYYPEMDAYNNMDLKCKCLGIKRKGYIEEKLELVGLADVGKKPVKNYSLGMKQRLGIAMALVGEPDILLLDEPINGLDPEGIVEIRETLMKLNSEFGITIIISSHILEELSKIVTSYCFIDKGAIIKQITKDELDRECNERIEIVTEQVSGTTTILDKMKFTNYKVVDSKTIEVYERIAEVPELIFELAKNNIRINKIGAVSIGIEKYFLDIMGGDKND